MKPEKKEILLPRLLNIKDVLYFSIYEQKIILFAQS